MADDIVEEIKARIALSSVVGRRTKLTRKGRGDFMALCPFHGEKSPSFHVMDDKGAYYCFGCGEKGDLFTFVQKTENLSFREALEKLAAEAGVALPAPNPEAKAAADRRKTLHDALEAACAWFESQLKTQGAAAARDYLARRGLDPATIGRFRLGHAPGAGSRLAEALTGRGFETEQLAAAGLIRVPEDGRAPFDWFRDRVMFPIADLRGRVIAFGARTLGDGEPKYLNSPDSPVFHKGETLFNLAQAREAAHQTQRVVVVEGYMDVIALAQAGIGEAVAPLGTALTEAQLELLWRVAPEPILCFDGDKAGQRAAARALARALPLLKPGHSLRFLTLPDGLDPDDLVRRDGAAGMAGRLEQAVPLVDFLWAQEQAAADLSTPERRAAFEERLGQVLREIADPRIQAHYRQALRSRVRALFAPPPAPERAALPRDRSAAGRGRWPGKGPEDRFLGARAEARARLVRSEKGRLTADRGAVLERLLLLILIRHPALIPRLENDLIDVHLVDSELDRLRHEVLRASVAVPDLDSTRLKDHLAARGFAERVDQLEQDALLGLQSFARSEAALGVAEQGWRHALERHRRQTVLAQDLESARRAYIADPANPGLEARMKGIEDELIRIEAQALPEA